jgi:hypothetical protein
LGVPTLRAELVVDDADWSVHVDVRVRFPGPPGGRPTKLYVWVRDGVEDHEWTGPVDLPDEKREQTVAWAHRMRSCVAAREKIPAHNTKNGRSGEKQQISGPNDGSPRSGYLCHLFGLIRIGTDQRVAPGLDGSWRCWHTTATVLDLQIRARVQSSKPP